MKIGILTYHRSHNYGALLQAIALRSVLVELGHLVTFIDYWPDYHKRLYSVINWRRILSFWHPISCIRYIIKTFMCKNLIKKRVQNSLDFINSYIEPHCSSVQDTYDVVICGSDQIWRKQPENFGYNPFYFGQNNISATKQISYAASMGILPITMENKSKVKQLISNLDAISVRENDLYRLVISLGFDNICVSLDPTLLLSAQQWNFIIPVMRPVSIRYALFYEVATDSFDEKQMRIFCNNNGLKLVVLRTQPLRNETDSNLFSVPANIFVNLIRHADFVFTSSFHGLAFSIIYHKNFLCSVSAKKQGRVISLLENLKIEGHYIEPMSQIPLQIDMIDYDKTEKYLNDLRLESIDYLTRNI